MEFKAIFIYEKRTFEIQCNTNEELNTIYGKFVNKLNPNLSINDFDYFLEGKKIGKNIKNLQEFISENKKDFISKNKKDFISENKKEITICVEKRSKIVKCPVCICNDCIIDIDDYIIKFYGCKYKHTDFKIFDDYKGSQKIDFSKIFCKYEGCEKNESNDPEDFYKCLTCCDILKHTQYYCTYHKKEDEKKYAKKHNHVNYDHKNFICNKHIKKFLKYCFKCRKNLCEDCEADHKNHQIKDYNSMSPIVEEIKKDLDTIKGKMEELRIIVDYIKRNLLDGTMKIYENYCEILKDVIEKYEYNNKELKNYGVLKNFLNLRKSDRKILKDLDEVIKEDNYKKKAYFLIDMFQKDLDNYKNLQNNINNVKKIFEDKANKPDDLDDFMQWEGKSIEEVKDKRNESPSIKKKKSGKITGNTTKTKHKEK